MQDNSTKFQLMMNDRKRTIQDPEPTFTLQSTTLENEDSVKLLGIKIDRCMQESQSTIECTKMPQLYT